MLYIQKCLYQREGNDARRHADRGTGAGGCHPAPAEARASPALGRAPYMHGAGRSSERDPPEGLLPREGAGARGGPGAGRGAPRAGHPRGLLPGGRACLLALPQGHRPDRRPSPGAVFRRIGHAVTARGRAPDRHRPAGRGGPPGPRGPGVLGAGPPGQSRGPPPH